MLFTLKVNPIISSILKFEEPTPALLGAIHIHWVLRGLDPNEQEMNPRNELLDHKGDPVDKSTCCTNKRTRVWNSSINSKIEYVCAYIPALGSGEEVLEVCWAASLDKKIQVQWKTMYQWNKQHRKTLTVLLLLWFLPAHTWAHTPTHAHTYTPVCIHTHVCTYTYFHTDTQLHTHTQTCRYTHLSTHIHKPHTHTQWERKSLL